MHVPSGLNGCPRQVQYVLTCDERSAAPGLHFEGMTVAGGIDGLECIKTNSYAIRNRNIADFKDDRDVVDNGKIGTAVMDWVESTKEPVGVNPAAVFGLVMKDGREILFRSSVPLMSLRTVTAPRMSSPMKKGEMK